MADNPGCRKTWDAVKHKAMDMASQLTKQGSQHGYECRLSQGLSNTNEALAVLKKENRTEKKASVAMFTYHFGSRITGHVQAQEYFRVYELKPDGTFVDPTVTVNDLVWEVMLQLPSILIT